MVTASQPTYSAEMEIPSASLLHFEERRPRHPLDGAEIQYVIVEALPQKVEDAVSFWQWSYLSLWQHLMLFTNLTSGPWVHYGDDNASNEAPDQVPTCTVGCHQDQATATYKDDQPQWQTANKYNTVKMCKTPAKMHRASGSKFFKAGFDEHGQKRDETTEQAHPSEATCAGGNNKRCSHADKNGTEFSKSLDKPTSQGGSEVDFAKAIAEHEDIMAQRQREDICFGDNSKSTDTDVKLERKILATQPPLPQDVVVYEKHLTLSQLRSPKTRLKNVIGLRKLTPSPWYSDEEMHELVRSFESWLPDAFSLGLSPEAADAFVASRNFIQDTHADNTLSARLTTLEPPIAQGKGKSKAAAACLAVSSAWHKLQPDTQQLIKDVYASSVIGKEQSPTHDEAWIGYKIPNVHAHHMSHGSESFASELDDYGGHDYSTDEDDSVTNITSSASSAAFEAQEITSGSRKSKGKGTHQRQGKFKAKC